MLLYLSPVLRFSNLVWMNQPLSVYHRNFGRTVLDSTSRSSLMSMSSGYSTR